MRFRSLLLVLTLVPMPTFPLVAQDYYRDSAPQLDLPQVGSGPVSIAPAPPQVDTPMSRPASGGAIPEYGRPAYDPNDPSSAQNPDSSYADRYQSPPPAASSYRDPGPAGPSAYAAPTFPDSGTLPPPPRTDRLAPSPLAEGEQVMVAPVTDPVESPAETSNDKRAGWAEGRASVLSAITSRDPKAMLELLVKFGVPALMALLILLVAYLVASASGKFVGATISKRLDITLGKFFGKSTKTAIMLMAVVGVLGYFGIDVTSFAAVLAAAGFAVGMALQGTLGNFAAGVMLLVFRPFKVGDYVMIGGNEGTVDEIELFTTRINTRDNRHIIVPNDDIFGQTIINYTHNSLRRVDVVVGVSYDADLSQTRRLLDAVARNVDGGYSDPAPQVVLNELNSSSVDWAIRVWTHPAKYAEVKERIIELTKHTLDRAGIGIPYPQLDLHVIQKSAQQQSKAG